MNDDQPEILTDTVMKKQSADDNQLPDAIHLLNSKEATKKRKIRAVVRFHKFNEIKELEKLAHHLLMLYFPWRNEGQLLGESGTYASKHNESSTWRIMERNKTFLEPHADELQNAQDIVSRQSASQIYHMLHSSLQGTEEEEESNITSDFVNAQSNFQSRQNSHQLTSRLPVLTSIDHTALDNDALHAMVRLLNEQQRLAFDTVLTWCRSVAKSPSTHEQVHSLQLFITGGAGAGKSHLIIKDTLSYSSKYIQTNFSESRKTICFATSTNRHYSNQHKMYNNQFWVIDSS